ncbi:MAG: hypothetical protein H6595_11600 [Flavobacteriales bacterium]|nr:hypothetical protein [Flavobacteriales bacterium]MCB9168104.1 hypothetical protein [Flavobacteriales bacterium]
MADGSPTLRVGVMLDGPVVQQWQADCLQHVLDVPGVQLVVCVRKTDTAAPRPSLPQRILRHPWRIALYLRYRRRHFRPPAMREVDIRDRIAGAPTVVCTTTRKGHGEYFSDADLDAIRGHRPDVLLRFGFGIIRGAILEVPTHGVWSFHHGDEQHYRGGPPGFWEIMHREPVVGAILQRLTDTLDAGIILRKGWFPVVDHSLPQTVDQVLHHSAIWPAQVMRSLLQGRALPTAPATTSAPILRYPRNLMFLRFLLRTLTNKWRFHRGELNAHEEWNIGVLYQPVQSLLQEVHSLNVRWLPAPGKNTFRADPFGILDEEGQLIVLYEKYDHRTGLGEISRLRPKRDNVLKRSRSILATGTHLSYPFIVRHAGAVYVVPESASTGRVELYRSDAQLSIMDHVTTLLEVPLFDPSLVHHAGRWWLFGTRPPLSNTELYLYHSERLEGPYVPHVMNPVKTDVRSARPGGTFFMDGGVLYRPAQDSSRTYGGRIALNRVTELSTTAYNEELVKYIGPVPGSAWCEGMHTLTAIGDITLVDGKRMVHVPARQEQVRSRKVQRLKERLRS